MRQRDLLDRIRCAHHNFPVRIEQTFEEFIKIRLVLDLRNDPIGFADRSEISAL